MAAWTEPAAYRIVAREKSAKAKTVTGIGRHCVKMGAIENNSAHHQARRSDINEMAWERALIKHRAYRSPASSRCAPRHAKSPYRMLFVEA